MEEIGGGSYRVTLPESETGTNNGSPPGPVEMQIDGTTKGFQKMCEGVQKQLLSEPTLPSSLRSTLERLVSFSKNELIDRLAEEKIEAYENTMVNARCAYASAKVIYRGLGDVKNRIRSVASNLESFLTNISKLLMAGIFKGIAKGIEKVGPKLFRFVGEKLASWPRTTKALSGLVAKLRGYVDDFSEWMKKLKDRIRNFSNSRMAPKGIDGHLPEKTIFETPPPKSISSASDVAAALEKEIKEAERLLRRYGTKAKEAAEEAAKLRHKVASSKAALTKLNSLLDTVVEGQEKVAGRTVASVQKEVARRQAEILAMESDSIPNALQKAKNFATDAETQEAVVKNLQTSGEQMSQSLDLVDQTWTLFMKALNSVSNVVALAALYMLAWFADKLDAKFSGYPTAIANSALSKLALRGVVNVELFTAQAEKSCSEMIQGFLSSAFGKLSAPYVVEKYGNIVKTNYLSCCEAALSAAIDETMRWQQLNKEDFHQAVRWYYQGMGEALSKVEEDEAWYDSKAEILNWIEGAVVWGMRVANLLLGILGLCGVVFTGGLALPAWLATRAGVTAFIEGLDTAWDWLKAAGSSLTSWWAFASISGFIGNQVIFTSLMYRNSQILSAAASKLRSN